MTELIDPPTVLDMSQQELEDHLTALRERRNRVAKIARGLAILVVAMSAVVILLLSSNGTPPSSTSRSLSSMHYSLLLSALSTRW
jgi:hypothetical protein